MLKRLLSGLLITTLIISLLTIPRSKVEAKSDKHPTGEIDMVNLLDEIKGEEWARNAEASIEEQEDYSYPTSFDLREYGLVTPVKDQGDYGICWAFASCAAMESNAIMMGFGEYDLSEYHLGYWSNNISEAQDPSMSGDGRVRDNWYNSGGSAYMATSTLMKGYGPALEKRFPYKNIKKALDPDTINAEKPFSISQVLMVSANEIICISMRNSYAG